MRTHGPQESSPNAHPSHFGMASLHYHQSFCWALDISGSQLLQEFDIAPKPMALGCFHTLYALQGQFGPLAVGQGHFSFHFWVIFPFRHFLGGAV